MTIKTRLICSLLASVTLSYAEPTITGSTFACFGGERYRCQSSSGGNQPNPFEFYDTFSPPGVTGSFLARGSSLDGPIRLNSTMQYDISGPPTNAYTGASMSFFDDYTFTSASLNGQVGFVSYDFALDATLIKTGTVNSYLSVVEVRSPYEGPYFYRVIDASFSGLLQYRGDGSGVPVVFGRTDTRRVGFSAISRGDAVDAYGLPYNAPLASGSGSATITASLVLNGFTVTDSRGNLVTDAKLTTASGAQYSINGVPSAAIPEPATGALFASALGVLGTVAASRRFTRGRR